MKVILFGGFLIIAGIIQICFPMQAAMKSKARRSFFRRNITVTEKDIERSKAGGIGAIIFGVGIMGIFLLSKIGDYSNSMSIQDRLHEGEAVSIMVKRNDYEYSVDVDKEIQDILKSITFERRTERNNDIESGEIVTVMQVGDESYPMPFTVEEDGMKELDNNLFGAIEIEFSDGKRVKGYFVRDDFTLEYSSTRSDFRSSALREKISPQ